MSLLMKSPARDPESSNTLLFMIWLFIASFVVVIVSAIAIDIPVVGVPDIVVTPAIVIASSVAVIGAILGVVCLSLVAFQSCLISVRYLRQCFRRFKAVMTAFPPHLADE